MKIYTVKEIAATLKVNEEQVRRWIRIEVLKATLKSKKQGYVIYENDLNDFIKKHPKYDKEAKTYSDSINLNNLEEIIKNLEIQQNNLTVLIESLKTQLKNKELL